MDSAPGTDSRRVRQLAEADRLRTLDRDGLLYALDRRLDPIYQTVGEVDLVRVIVERLENLARGGR